MKYDFTSVFERKGFDAIAVESLGSGDPSFVPLAPEEGFDIIPMWVADMNFPTCPSITDAIIKRAQHPAFGYFETRPEYYDSIIRWHEQRHGVKGLDRSCIGYENGVLGGVLSAMRVFCPRGDKVLLHSPTYIGFTGSLTNAGYRIVLSPLKKDAGGVWRMDPEDMEKKIVAENIHTAVFCSPHNPTGRVWSAGEIRTFMEICKKHDVQVISDEIWSDLILTGHRHIPTQSVSEDARDRTIALYAPSKTFNLAGLIGSYHIVYNRAIRDRLRKESALTHYNTMNVLSMHALIGAYSPAGAEWTDELCQVLTQNVDRACSFIRQNTEGIEVTPPEGTYMLFADCTKYCAAHGISLDELLRALWRVGVAVQDGRPFHGPCHIRINLALPLSKVQEAGRRFEKYVLTQ